MEKKSIDYQQMIISEIRTMSSKWIPEITDLTKEELQSVVHYIGNYSQIYILTSNNQKELYEKIVEFKKWILNKKIREKLVYFFYKEKELDFRKVFKDINFKYKID